MSHVSSDMKSHENKYSHQLALFFGRIRPLPSFVEPWKSPSLPLSFLLGINCQVGMLKGETEVMSFGTANEREEV